MARLHSTCLPIPPAARLPVTSIQRWARDVKARDETETFEEIRVEEHDSDVIFYTGSGNMPFRTCTMKNVQYNRYYGNSSVIVDLAVWQIPRSTERISTVCLKKNIPDIFSRNSRKHCWIFIMFGKNVTEKVSNQ